MILLDCSDEELDSLVSIKAAITRKLEEMNLLLIGAQTSITPQVVFIQEVGFLLR